ncbi:hypothetical protein GCM10027451_02490 [Geodermatophilus aquaeductus]|uniref:Glycosyl transferases group 1 n=1 Tax=Geodermatophilus aquaeductus TaxID=1564161 RepID=A0A521CIA9_9ACTN|nr:hypothetical protein [Geodermatophilus aquaeductus]SMO59189.1 hypothetical protein SAMN06273567_102426 [Geodermatophilus aquaeductus]
MSIKHAKRVTFVCPIQPTGGPEAIHQASQVLNQQGVRSDILYLGEANVTIANGRVTTTPPADNPCLRVYEQYEPRVCTGALLRRHHLFVLPEVYASSHRALAGASVAVWWLSVDNVHVTHNPVELRALMAATSLRHFHQSEYAADFLRGHGVRTSMPLFDYTTPEFTSHEPQGPGPEAGIAYNPVKGADLSAAFFAGHPEHRAVPIQGMTKAQIVDLLRRTSVYVDFGHLPGKDRLPREAAVSGSIVFVRRAGAGLFAEDFPVPDFFRFDDADVHSGELARRVAAVQADPAGYWDQQETFRRAVRGERDELYAQVLALRGRQQAA